jgi:tryptophan synthase alpha chain
VSDLEARLRAARDAGRKLLVPYITGGLDGDEWLDVLRAIAAAGADAIEIGLPFSDPVMDGPVIQAATVRALEQGATPAAIVAAMGSVDVELPLVIMTSYNICFRAGHERFASMLAEHGVAGAILPDVPVDEIGPWAEAADAAGVDTVLLAAPTTPDDRLDRICARSRGFVYAIGTLGVTGEREQLAATAATIAKRVRAHTDRPVLVGVGVSTPAQAAEAAAEADGVIVGTALVRRILDGAGPEGAAEFVAQLRAGLDGV